jgi:hypothetical protein
MYVGRDMRRHVIKPYVKLAPNVATTQTTVGLTLAGFLISR